MSVERCIQAFAATEALLIALIARLAPWLPPLPTAWLVYDRTARYLSWPPWAAGAAALSVECLGLLVTLTALELYSYNREKLKSEPKAPLAIPLALIGVYLLVAELLTVGLDLLPRLASGEPLGVVGLAPACFPPLSLVGMLLLAVRADHRARLADNEAEREQRRQKRKAGRQEQNRAESTKSAEGELSDLDRDRLYYLRQCYPDGESFSRGEVETMLSLGSTASLALLSRLLSQGIVMANGRGRARRYRFLQDNK